MTQESITLENNVPGYQVRTETTAMAFSGAPYRLSVYERSADGTVGNAPVIQQYIADLDQAVTLHVLVVSKLIDREELAVILPNTLPVH